MNNLARGNFVLMFFVLIGMIVLVGAVTWNPSAYNTTYYFLEDTTSYHNFTVNLSDSSDLSYFSILNISWVQGSGLDHSDFYWLPWDDTDFSNSVTGVLKLNTTNNNETGNFTLNVLVQGSGGGSSRYFEFIINATNDNPNFTLNSDYNVSVPIVGNTTKNISLVGSDEEEQYPLEYNVSFLNCSFALWSSRNNSNCNLTYSMISESNTTSTLALSNLTYNDVGTYNLTICTKDNINGSSLPAYYDSNYIGNKSYCQNTTLTLLSSFSVNISNCTGQILTEDVEFNCTINVTTIGETDELNISSLAFFKNDSDSSSPDNPNWFYSDTTSDAVNFVLEIPISVTPRKEEVGNWTINFSVDDGLSINITQITLYVNWTEESVSLNSISNLTGANAIYENGSFTVNAYDNDLLILDDSVRNEQLTYASNTSWVNVTSPTSFHGVNYTISTVSINYDNISSAGDLNYSVRINVTDVYGNSANQIFVIEILNDTAPEWNNMSDPVSLNLTEDVIFYYNVSMNVTDAENDTITFYYENISAEFCSLNSSTFTTSGIINFTPVDCDVGYHNVTIIASDGKVNSSSKQFNFTIKNVADTPSISDFENATAYEIANGSTYNATEDVQEFFNLTIDDDDFLIPSNQSAAGFYNESMTISVNATNSTGSEVDLFDFSFIEYWGDGSFADYVASFTPTGAQVDNYTIFINISDVSGNSTNITFYLNISASNDAPNLTTIANQSFTINDIFNLDINATDEEDGNDTLGVLTYSLNFTYGSDFVNGNESIFNTTSGIFNLVLNSTYSGEYRINVTVNDSVGIEDSQLFYLYVYGAPNITFPASSYQFDWIENVSTVNLNFTIDYDVNNTNLTYKFYLDKIVYSNSTTYSYMNTTIISSDNLRNNTNYTWLNNTNYTWNFTPDYTDESYGMLKNLTLLVYNPNYPELNNSVNWKVNITHKNQNVSFSGLIPTQPGYVGTGIIINLSEYFTDVDYWDKNISQTVNFSLSTINGSGYVIADSSFNAWILTLNSPVATDEYLTITAHEYDSSNISIGNATSNSFEVEFIPPVVEIVKTPSSRTTSTTQLKYFSLRIIVPQDVIISGEGYIEIPFSLYNSGTTDLSGINLGSQVLFNNEFSDDIKILFNDTYVPTLKIGETKNYTMKFLADTDVSGRYKATIFANVTSPKFSDWGDFFIDLRRANETEAENMLIFIEKLISENPECLELTELFQRAENAFFSGDYNAALKLSEEVSNACEDAITANEQIRYNVEGFVQNNFYYISFTTLVIFFIGFIFYVYKRVRFNKSRVDEYV